MRKPLARILQNYPHPYLTDAELVTLLDGTADSRYGKVKRMLAQGKLLSIKKGLYCLTEEMGYFKKPNSFELAQFIYGPSLISLESALSFYSLIPEAVYTTTSVTSKRSKEFKTPLGVFSYRRVPSEDLYLQVTRFYQDGQYFFIAKPWRAICDYVFSHRLNWDSIEPLIHSLRMELDSLPHLSIEDAKSLAEYYQHNRVHRFLKGVQKDLKSATKKKR